MHLSPSQIVLAAVCSKAKVFVVIDPLFIVAPIVEVYVWSLFSNVILSVLSSLQ